MIILAFCAVKNFWSKIGGAKISLNWWKFPFESFEGQNESFLFVLCFVIYVLITFHFNYTKLSQYFFIIIKVIQNEGLEHVFLLKLNVFEAFFYKISSLRFLVWTGVNAPLGPQNSIFVVPGTFEVLVLDSWSGAILEFDNFLVLTELSNLVPEPFGYGASIPGYEFILFGITNNGLRSRSFWQG